MAHLHIFLRLFIEKMMTLLFVCMCLFGIGSNTALAVEEAFTNAVGIEFVLIPSGSFIMGVNNSLQAYPPHKVSISRPFYLGRYEITQKQWQKIMGKNPSRFKGENNQIGRAHV